MFLCAVSTREALFLFSIIQMAAGNISQPLIPYKPPAPAVDRVLNTNDAVEVLEAVLPAQNKSYELGLKFKLPPHEVKAIHSSQCEPRECLRDVVIRFLERTEPGPTWRVIIDALRSPLVDLPALASKLEAVHFPDSTSTGGVVTETTGRSFCLMLKSLLC